MSRDTDRIRRADDDHIARDQPVALEWEDGSGLADLESWEYLEHDGSDDGGVTAAPANPQELRELVVAQLDVDPEELAVDDDLISWGMDSIRVMAFANRFRRAGLEIKFAELIGQPTLAAWWTLLEERVAAAPASSRSTPAVDPQAQFPLTPVQHAYWVGRSDGQVLGGVGCHFYVEFDGVESEGTAVDPIRLERAVRALSNRHGLLRARFEDGMQEILPNSPWPGLTVHELRELPDEQLRRHLRDVRDRLSHRRLDVDRGEVFDVQLSRLPGAATRVHVNIDLMVADVLSIQIMFGDLAALYADPGAELPPVRYPFAQYLVDQECRRTQVRAQARRYWEERLPELPGGPHLPLVVDPEKIERPRVMRREIWLSRRQWDALSERARRHGVTLPMAMVAAFAEVLAAWSAEHRFLLNLPLFDRETLHPDVPHMVADFTNLFLLFVDVSDEIPFAHRAARLARQFRSDAAHSEYSGVEVLRDLARTNTAAAGAPVVFTSAIGMGELVPEPLRRQLGNPGWMISQTPQVWLDHQVVEFAGGLLVNWDAVEELFPVGVLDAMFGAYRGLLEWLMVSDWSDPAPVGLPAEQAVVRARVNATQTVLRWGGGSLHGGLLHGGFFAMAGEQPGRVALAWGESDWLKYGELAIRALRVAALLGRAGHRPDELVAVSVPKGVDQIVAVLGVLAAGGGYVPVGVDQPELRWERMVRRAGVRFVLCADPQQVPDIAGVRVLGLREAVGVEPLPGPVQVAESAVAYVIFTSGSTGEPKGVQITHAAAVNTVAAVSARFGVGPDDRVLAVSALDFDLSVYDVFGLLGAGGAVVLIEEQDRREARRWVELARHWAVTVWNTVPALLDMLLVAAAGAEPQVPGLRLVLVSGDWVGLDLPDRLAQAAPAARLVALGGATEAAIWSNAWEVVGQVPTHWRSVPYGFPLANQCYRVVDGLGRDCPDWVTGELWIGGTGVAVGYRGDPELTAVRFVEHEGLRWYRTGDRGRYWPDGTLEFLGRVDHQVKIRGHRLELGEIEAALQAHPRIEQAAAVAVGDRTTRLAAFLVPTPGTDPTDLITYLGPYLAERLPSHAIPTTLTPLTRLPLTPNGKADRRALIERAAQGAVPERFEPPQGWIEDTVAAIWAELLDADRIGRTEDFFGLGGDSLLATRLITRLRGAGLDGAELSTLFASPVLHEFAAQLTTGSTPATTPELVTDPGQRHEPFPPTDVQRAYWMGRTDTFTLGGVGCHFYTEFEGDDIDIARLEEAWNRLIDRHEMLRAVFDPDGRQRILREVPRFTIPLTEIDADTGGAAQWALDTLRASMSHQVIDATAWPPFDVRAVRYGNRTRIGVSLDNIILDALSAMIVYSEVERLYADLDAELPSVEVSFRDYVVGTAPDPVALERAKRYWLDRTAQLPPGPQLPLAVNPAQIHKPVFVRRQTRIDASCWQTILDRARRHQLTPSSVLAAAFAEVLAAWSASPELTIDLTLFDRREVHPDINHILGDFTSLLLLAHRSVAGESWARTARRLQEQVWRDLEHSEVSAVWVLRELARRSGSLDVTMPVVFTSTIGLGANLPPSVAEPFAERVWGVSQTPQVWLDHQVVEWAGGLLINWDAVEELFPTGLLDAMFGAYRELVEWLAVSDWSDPAPVGLLAGQAVVNGGSLYAEFSPRVAVQPPDPGEQPPQGPPQGPVEEQIAELWIGLLALDTVGRGENFISLGGDSLLATQLVEEIRSRMGVEIALREFFAAPTVAQLAGLIEQRHAATGDFEEGAL